MHNAETVLWVSVTKTTDELSNETETAAEPVPVLAMVAGRSASESTRSDEPSVLTGKTLYLLDPTLVVSAADWFTVRGDRYEVEGEAHRWGSSGVEVAVQRASAQSPLET